MESPLHHEEAVAGTDIEAPGEAALIIGPRTRILYCTHLFSRMIHQPGLDLIGLEFINLLGMRDQKRFCRLLEQARRSRARGDFTLLTSAGKLLVHLSVSTLPGDGAPAYGILATGPGALPRGLLSAVLEARGPIIVCDHTGTVIWANRAARDVAGRDPRSLPFIQAFPVIEQEAGKLLDQVEVGVCVVSPNGRIREANRRWREIFGEQPMNLPPIDRVQARNPEGGKGETTDSELGQAGSTVQEFSTEQKDGTAMNVELRSRELPDGNTLLLARDVTKRRFLEREVMAINRREELRIGRDLHDQLAQSLAGIGFLTKVLEQKLRAQGMEESQDASRVGELVREAIRQARKLAQGLCPVDFAPDGLNTALGELCTSLATHLNVPCRFQSSGQLPKRSDTTVTQLYMITRELVTSAITEGGATWVTVRLDNGEKKSSLTLEHNAPDRGKRITSDIAGYRASLIGARLSFSRKEEGTTVVRCTLPHP